MLIGGFDVFKSRQVGLFSDHIPFESSNLSTVFLEPKTSGHLQPCDLNVFGPMKQSYRRKLNHQLFEKAKNLEAKVALTEYEGIKLCLESFFGLNQRTINVSFFKTGMVKFKEFSDIDQWSVEDQEEFLLNKSYEAHLFQFYNVRQF